MSTTDPEFYQAPKFTPEPPPALPKQRGCFFYGCIIASILAVLFVILMGVILFLLYRFANQAIEEYTSTTPRQLPTVEMPAEKRQALKDRVDAFDKAVEAGTPIDPLVLDSDDLNALIEDNPDFKGTVHVKIDGDEIKGQVSFPLDKLGWSMVRGRYLNGEADFKASLSNGVLIVTLDSFEVNGKRPPEEVMKGIRNENIVKDIYREPKNAEKIRKLESLEVKDGKIVIKVRAKGGTASDTPKTKKEAPPRSKPRLQVQYPSPKAPPKGEPTKPDDAPKAEPPKVGDVPKTEVKASPAEPAAPKR